MKEFDKFVESLPFDWDGDKVHAAWLAHVGKRDGLGPQEMKEATRLGVDTSNIKLKPSTKSTFVKFIKAYTGPSAGVWVSWDNFTAKEKIDPREKPSVDELLEKTERLLDLVSLMDPVERARRRDNPFARRETHVLDSIEDNQLTVGDKFAYASKRRK
jgi:hypothetical protein